MKINGIAHVALSVMRMEISVPFYESFLTFLEFRCVHRSPRMTYFIGGRSAIALQPAGKHPGHERFVQTRVGLHHLCFRAYARPDVDRFYQHLVSMEAKIVHPPEEGAWAPGYYSVLFEDPDGIRLEMNFVPGTGLLAEGVRIDPLGYE
ncbi:MAG: VOC family protein [Betaproteobacteria bacterium]|nr:VOC family protein [Betaproteobacteria bacterium]